MDIGYLQLADSVPEFRRKILDIWLSQLNRAIPKAVPNIAKHVKVMLANMIPQTDTYKSLYGGELQGHFGIPNSELNAKLAGIVNEIVNTVLVEFTPLSYGGRNITGGISITAFPADWSYITQSDFGVVSTEAGDLPWLEWLLVKGDRIVIANYEIFFHSGAGRSGQAIMVESPNGFWRVPPEFSGTAENNWFTRMLESDATTLNDRLTEIVLGEIENVL